jgi:hypothetical protein
MGRRTSGTPNNRSLNKRSTPRVGPGASIPPEPMGQAGPEAVVARLARTLWGD